MNPLLFDQPPDFRFKGAGHRRTHMGALIEEVVCALLGLKRNGPGGSGVYQADAHTAVGFPVEIKSVCINGKDRGKSVLYDFRLEKDSVHAPQLAYVFACHRSTGKGKAKTAAEFLDRLTDSLTLAIVPGWQVRLDALACPHHAIKTDLRRGKRCGYQRAGYADGYRNLEVQPYLSGHSRALPQAVELWGRTFRAESRLFVPDPWIAAPEGLPAVPFALE